MRETLHRRIRTLRRAAGGLLPAALLLAVSALLSAAAGQGGADRSGDGIADRPPETPIVYEPPVAAHARPATSAPAARWLREPAREPVVRDTPRAGPTGSFSTLDEPTGSPSLARALERERAKPAPPNEIFALVTLTDRRSGERRAFARGSIDLRAAAAIDDPDAAPEGIAYEEGDVLSADEEVEVATRYIAAHETRRRAAVAAAREDEEERDLRERNADAGLSHRIDGSLRQRIRLGEIDLAGDATVQVVIELRGMPRLELPKNRDLAPGGLLYAGLDVRAARERGLIERKRDAAARQAGLVRAIEAAGGQVRRRSWMSGAVRADLPARAIEGIAARGDVFRIEYEAPEVPFTHRYVYADYYQATDAQDFDPGHGGQHGLAAKHGYSSRVVLSMAEECIDLTNPAWLTAGGSWNRAWFYDCDPSGPCAQGGVEECSGSLTHGTKVAQIMAGDFRDGQDPALGVFGPWVVTGACEECRFIFFQDQNLNERDKAMEASCAFGVDIFESSIGGTEQSCDGNGPYDGDVESLIDCDTVWVQAAANNGSGGGCTTAFPADHPWTFTVGGILTENPCSSSGWYYTSNCPYDPMASKGGATYDNFEIASVIDLAAPYRYGNLLIPLTRNPVQWGDGWGTSFSAPLVTGLMARLMDWWRVHVGDSIFFDNRMRNVMLLMGDRSAGSVGSLRVSNDTDERWGAGRVGLIPFDQRPFVYLVRASLVLGADETWILAPPPVPSATDFYKAVVWHDGTDYSNEPAIGLSLLPGGCVISGAEAYRYDSKTVVAGHAFGTCSTIDARIDNVKVGFSGARRFHYAAYADLEDERGF